VLLRISTLDSVQPVALSELNDVLGKLLSGGGSGKKNLQGGVGTAAEILNFMGSALEAEMMENVRGFDLELAQKIEDKMFIFENIMEIDDRGIQLILREVQSESLIIALKGTNEELREKIFRNMSQRAAEIMREDLESKGPVRLSDVEANQKEILKIVRRLSDEGHIALGSKNEESYV
jgi:flagellar motor switch protein FliG